MKLRPRNFRELPVKLELSMERSVSHRIIGTFRDDAQTIVGKDGGYPKLILFVRRLEISFNGIGDAEISISYVGKLKSYWEGIGDTETSTLYERTFGRSFERIGVAPISWRILRYPWRDGCRCRWPDAAQRLRVGDHRLPDFYGTCYEWEDRCSAGWVQQRVPGRSTMVDADSEPGERSWR